MSLGCFRQIRSAFHPETGSTAIGDKCHHLRFLIQNINMTAKKTFHIGPKLAFDEGDSKHYFVTHINVYQGGKAGNIDVDEKAKYLPTTMKATVNACIASGISNHPGGACTLYMDNRYTCPEVFAILQEDLNLLAAGT
eukprot:5427160-Ditylum_brightwellii.AAC.1